MEGIDSKGFEERRDHIFELLFGCHNDECRRRSLDKVVRLEKLYQIAINAATYKPTAELLQQGKEGRHGETLFELKNETSVEIHSKK